MKTKAPKLTECQHVLIVEGYSDMQFYLALLRHLGRDKGVYFQILEGKSNILNRDTLGDFITPKLLADKASIGIILDADEKPSGTAESAKAHLKAITWRDVTEGQWQEEAGQARLGLFVAPDTQTKGEVETLTWNSFAEDEQYAAMKAVVGDFLGKMEEIGWKTHSPDKGRIGAYLSAAYDEDPRLGPGAREQKFNFDTPGFARLRAFLEVLPTS